MKKIGHLYENPVEIVIAEGLLFVCEKGTKLKVAKECFDEHYLHESTYYPREGLKEKKLNKGDIVEVLGCWANFYGHQIRCSFNNEIFDLKPQNLTLID